MDQGWPGYGAGSAIGCMVPRTGMDQGWPGELQLVAWCNGLAWIRDGLVRVLVLQLVAWCHGLAWIMAGIVSFNGLHGATDWHGSGLAW